MAIYATAGDSDYTPAPAGVHEAVLCDVVDLGLQDVTWEGRTKKIHKVQLIWQIEEQTEQGHRMTVAQRYTNSTHKKANLGKVIRGWLARDLTPEEMFSPGFDLEGMLNKGCQLNVVHNPGSDGRVWANVDSVIPLGKNSTPLEVDGYTRKGGAPSEPELDDDGDEAPFGG